jgi:hypothetical protein
MARQLFIWKHDRDETCQCGARYRIEKRHEPTRDKDKLECGKCGAVLQEWNGGVVYQMAPLPPLKQGASR